MAHAKDYIPGTVEGFYTFQDVFYNRLMEKLGSFKLTADDLKALTAARSKYLLAYGRAENVNGRTHADVVELQERTADYKAAIRAVVNEYLRANHNVSDYDRAYLQLTVPDKTPTRAPRPTTYPEIVVDFSATQRHTLHLHDNELRSKRHPAGVDHAEIFAKFGGEPLSDTDMQLVGTTGNSVFQISYDASQSGTVAHYRARWVNAHHEEGPFGALAKAFIA